MTRATRALLQGHLVEALHFHPLVLVALPLLAAVAGTNVVHYVRTGQWDHAERLSGRTVNALLALLLALTFGVWIARFFGAFGGPAPV